MTVMFDSLLNANWMKQSLDLPKGVDTLEELEEYLLQIGVSPAEWVNSGSWEAAMTNPANKWLQPWESYLDDDS